MNNPKIYADFNNIDPNGNIRLNVNGSISDIEKLGLDFKCGMKVIISDDELEVSGIVEYSELENIWVANVKWSEMKYLNE